MTLESYISKTKIWWRIQLISAGIFMLGLLMAGIPTSFLVARIDKDEVGGFTIIFTSVSFLLVAAIMFYGLVEYPKHRLRQLGLRCPNCNKQLVGLSSQVVVATGRCGFCGGQVLN